MTAFDPTVPAPALDALAEIAAAAVNAAPAGVVRELDIPAERDRIRNPYVVRRAEHTHGITRTAGDRGRGGRLPVWHRIDADPAEVARLQRRPSGTAPRRAAPPRSQDADDMTPADVRAQRHAAILATRPAPPDGHTLDDLIMGLVKAIEAACYAAGGAIAEPLINLPDYISRDLLTNPFMVDRAHTFDCRRVPGEPAVWCHTPSDDELVSPPWDHLTVAMAGAIANAAAA
jgi:hypothetical protein